MFVRPAESPAEWDPDHVRFRDVLETLNPLQYVPLVGSLYRVMTGESAHPAFRIGVSFAIAVAFGGPVGVLGTMAGCALEEALSGPQPPLSTLGPAPEPGRHREAASAYARVGALGA